MRSLTPTGLYIADYSALGSSSKVAGVAVDPETGVGYVALERIEEEGVEVDVFLMDPRNPTDFPDVLATVSSPVLAPFELPSYRSQALDIHFFPENRSLVVILAGGDIATIQLESTGADNVEIVGSVDSGIKAAAWSPDDEQLILVTGEDEVVCMNRLFDIIHEEPLRQEDFGEDKFINVGWGSKATQFHGSLGKAAARAQPASSSSTPSSLAHPTDDGLPIITFRGDAAFFAISSLDLYPDSSLFRRQIRIYTCSAHTRPTLSATSESLPGLEGQIDWRPSGNLLSGLVRYGYEGGGAGAKGRWEVAMLERNGLRHGGFELREGLGTWQNGRVRGMKWNADSEVLAIWIERDDRDVVQLWTMKNYHYYLKQEIFSHKPSETRFTGIRWHPEQALTLYIMGSGYVQTRSFVWDTFAAKLDMPNDTGSVAVIDGARLLVTPFRTQNTPPPMSSYVITLPSTPANISCSATDDSVAVLFGNGVVQVYDLNTKVPDPKSGSKLRGGGKVAEPRLRWEAKLAPAGAFAAKQIILAAGEVAALFWTDNEEGGMVVTARDGQVGLSKTVQGDVERLIWGEEAGWLVLDREGTLVAGDVAVDLCAQPLDVKYASKLFFALSSSGKLIFASLQSPYPQPIASSVTSITLTEDFLIYTTSAQSSHYAPIPTLQRMCNGEEVQSWETEWETRRIERGALAVVACPSSMSLVLQMPRGNLETVYPRPLVLAVVRKDVLRGAYRDALITCRKHRLDLNLLHDLDPKLFMDSLESFVEQVPEVDYLNLFVSSLTENDSSVELYQDLKRAASSSTVVKDKVNHICDALRAVLEKRDLLKYVETVLTTHVCKVPADYESGLRVLLHLQKEHPDVVEDAVKYIIFLSDVNQLYDVALGMYDFQLVLMVAQYSQKDPKEYLPFLRELKELSTWEQRFRIDDHLERRESALRSLQQAGDERFDDAAEYLARYELYDVAFKLYAGDEARLPRIYDLYGDYLYDRRDFYDSAIGELGHATGSQKLTLAYTLAGKTDKTLKAYERAHAWRELFALAVKEKLSEKAISDMVERVAEYLASRGRHLEAAQLYLEYTQDVDSAVHAVSSGADFAEAYRITNKYDRGDLVESAIWPGMDDAQEALLEVFEEMEGQLEKEVARLRALQKLRREDPDTFFIVDHDPDLEGVDVATNATTQASAFTRYTVAPTTAFSATTKMTGQTNRTRHKSSKKRAAGRKGTVDEYEYLLASLNRLILRVDEKSADAIALMRQLITASSAHRDLAKDLQETVMAFRQRLSGAIEEAWIDRHAILEGVTESGGMGLDGGAGLEKAREAVKGSVAEWKGLGALVG